MNKLKHLKTFISFTLMQLPMSRRFRYFFAQKGGVKFVKDNNSAFRSYIGSGVSFDTVFPENIIIENKVHITNGCIFLSHYLDVENIDESDIHWITGKIHIKEGTFIGTNSIITKPVTIGKNVIIGAGSIVTKDIPDYQIWAGNPARFIKERKKVKD